MFREVSRRFGEATVDRAFGREATKKCVHYGEELERLCSSASTTAMDTNTRVAKLHSTSLKLLKRVGGSLVALNLVILFTATLGCEPKIPVYPVHGVVLFEDGEPVRTGMVEFESLEHGFNARGTIGRDGRFQLGTFGDADGAVAGRHRAMVIQFLAVDSTPEIVHDHGDPVSRAMADYETSGLQFDVQPKDNELRISVPRAASHTENGVRK